MGLYPVATSLTSVSRRWPCCLAAGSAALSPQRDVRRAIYAGVASAAHRFGEALESFDVSPLFRTTNDAPRTSVFAVLSAFGGSEATGSGGPGVDSESLDGAAERVSDVSPLSADCDAGKVLPGGIVWRHTNWRHAPKETFEIKPMSAAGSRAGAILRRPTAQIRPRSTTRESVGITGATSPCSAAPSIAASSVSPERRVRSPQLRRSLPKIAPGTVKLLHSTSRRRFSPDPELCSASAAVPDSTRDNAAFYFL